jgi:hypothetical protein
MGIATGIRLCDIRPPSPLTEAESLPILPVPSTQRKEVIQCLLPSAVTSLGSPAKLSLTWQQGALSAWTSELQKMGRDGSHPAASFFRSGSVRAKVMPYLRGEIAELCLPSLRGALLSAEARLRAKADATKQSTLSSLLRYGLLRGTCHRARVRATRWLAMTLRRRLLHLAPQPCVMSLTVLRIAVRHGPGINNEPRRAAVHRRRQ